MALALVVLFNATAATAATTLAVPGRANATPTVSAAGAFVAVAWSATIPSGPTDIFVAVSRDGAKTFGTPVRVNDVAGDARVNGEQPPRIVLVPRSGGDPTMTVVWTTKGKTGTKLVSSRSDNGGRSFTPAVTVPDSDAAGNRGWENAVADASGRVYAVWLDHREMADHSMASGHHQHGEDPAAPRPVSEKPDGVAMAQMSKLYVGSLDASVAPHAVTPGVCYCCKTALAVGPNGAIYAAWRHVYPGNLRDIAFTMSSDGGRSFAPPARVSEDQWTLEGCPDDGPAMVVDGQSRVHVVWPTLIKDDASDEPTIGIFYATSADGRQFTPRARVPTEGVAHHPQITLDANGSPVLAWDEGQGGQRRVVFAVRASSRDGAAAFKRVTARDGASGVYPALARSVTVVAAWTAAQPSGAVIRVDEVNLGR